MAISIKWIKVRLTDSLSKVAEAILRQTYDDNKGYGFDLINNQVSRIDAKYIEKNLYKEIIILPSGVEKEINFERYTIFYFSIIRNKMPYAILMIESPPRSLKRFIKSFLDLIDDESFIETSRFDIEAFVDSLRNTLPVKKISIKKIVASNIQITKNSLSKIEIVSNEDAYQDFIDKFGDSNYLINRIKLSFLMDEVFGDIEASNTGMMMLNEYLYDYIDELLPFIVFDAL